MGRPKGSRNRPKSVPANAGILGALDERPIPETASADLEPIQQSTSTAPTTRQTLEEDRQRLLTGIDECKRATIIDGVPHEWTDWKTVAALQAQLNGVNRMLLKITGETAPTDANLIRSPQYLRLKAELIATLKQHPDALADVVKVFDTAEK